MKNEIFTDWLTASQYHPEGGLPLLTGGLVVFYDSQGLPRSERNQSTSITGSYDTRLRIGCDGYRLSISGNIGRFSRQDNLYNHAWDETKATTNRILTNLGFPAFTNSQGREGEKDFRRGAVVSRLDITCNYATGNELQARAAIRWLCARSVARVKRGNAGDESMWMANTRHMFKAYIKHIEMLAHGTDKNDPAYIYAAQKGLLRVEIELKKRFLSDLGMNDWGDITQEKLETLYRQQTEIMHQIDASDDPDILNSIPPRSRVFASAWLAGQDLKGLLTNGTLYRHAKVLREYGIDILQPRNVTNFPVKMRVLELQPTVAPQWYLDRNAA